MYNKYNNFALIVTSDRDDLSAVGPLVRRLTSLRFHVLAVSGKSGWESARVAYKNGAFPVVSQSNDIGTNRRIGWSEAYRRKAAALVDISPDGWYNPDTAVHMVMSMPPEGAVVACRKSARTSIESLLLRVRTGYKHPDWTSGMRVYSPKAISLLTSGSFQSKSDVIQIESLHYLLRNGVRIGTVNVPPNSKEKIPTSLSYYMENLLVFLTLRHRILR